jgi:hypothetical protein
VPGRHTKAQYKHHYDTYQGKPEQIKKRALRNKARAMMEKKVGSAAISGKDVDHIKPQRSGGATTLGNLRVASVKKNRGWR